MCWLSTLNRSSRSQRVAHKSTPGLFLFWFSLKSFVAAQSNCKILPLMCTAWRRFSSGSQEKPILVSSILCSLRSGFKQQYKVTRLRRNRLQFQERRGRGWACPTGWFASSARPAVCRDVLCIYLMKRYRLKIVLQKGGGGRGGIQSTRSFISFHSIDAINQQECQWYFFFLLTSIVKKSSATTLKWFARATSPGTISDWEQ